MKRCKRKFDEAVFDYLLYGEDPEEDALLLKDTVFPIGTYVVFKMEGPKGYFLDDFMYSFDLLVDNAVGDVSVPCANNIPVVEKEEYVYVNPLDVRIWFYGLPAKVMKYVLQKYDIEDGKIDIEKIYRIENGIK